MVRQMHLVKGLVRYKDRYLLLKKAKDIVAENVGKWEVPGGKIIVGEKPEETIIREIKEETRLNCKIVNELSLLEKELNGFISRCNVFLLEADADKVVLSDEHSEFRWVKPEEVKEMELVLFADLLLDYFTEVQLSTKK